MEKDKFVLVKHRKDSIHNFLFAIKKGVKVKPNDVVLCDTMKGYSIGYVAEIIEVPKMLANDLMLRCGAYGPLKNIIYAMPEDIYNKIIDGKQMYLTQVKDTLTSLNRQIGQLEEQLKGGRLW